jgi:NitT/TauT family transport system ATP-binding protein
MMAISRDMLRVKGLGKIFFNGAGEREPKVVLKELSFDLGENDSLAVMGPSGCGKTTLLLMIAGLLAPTEGSIRLDDEEVRKPSRKTALVLQEYGLFPWKSVAANITLGARLQKIPITDDERSSLMRELGIEGLEGLYPHQLSGGQRQRVALARALLLRPRAFCRRGRNHPRTTSQSSSRSLQPAPVRFHRGNPQHRRGRYAGAPHHDHE